MNKTEVTYNMWWIIDIIFAIILGIGGLLVLYQGAAGDLISGDEPAIYVLIEGLIVRAGVIGVINVCLYFQPDGTNACNAKVSQGGKDD